MLGAASRRSPACSAPAGSTSSPSLGTGGNRRSSALGLGDDGLEHPEPPDYHANPVDPSGSLVVTEWGWDLPDVIFRESGMTTTVHAIRDPRRGIVGAFREVMVSRKPPEPSG